MPRTKARKNANGATLGFEHTLWQAADKMRGHMDPLEYKHVVLSRVADAVGISPSPFARGTGEGAVAYYRLFPDEFQDSPLGKIPKGWKVMPLDQLADFVNGAACQKHPAEPGKPGLPVIKIRELGQGVSGQTDRVSLDIPDKHKANNGDVLFSWSGTLLCEIWTGGPCFVNQHLFKVTSDKYPRWFYLHWVKHHLEAFRGVVSGKATTMGHIKRSHLSEAMTMVPGPELLDKMTEVIAPLVESQVRTQLESEALSVIRDSLLPWLPAGSLSVGDIPQLSEAEA